MNKLYNIMKREKERNPDMDIYYSEKKKSLQYQNKEGTLTVLFRDDGLEDFYFRRNNDRQGAMLGSRIQVLADKGKYGQVESEPFFNMPQRFRDIAQNYQYDRENMNIDYDERKKGLCKPKHKFAFER